MLVAGRLLVSIPWEDTTDGNYYWQHCLWVDTDDFPNNFSMWNEVINEMQLLYTTQVQFRGLRFYYPGTEVVYFDQAITTPLFGERSPNGNYNILIVARWRLFGEDGSYSYHLHRNPTGEADLIDGVWSDAGYTRHQTLLNTFVSNHNYRTSTGAEITGGEVAQLPVQWQLRHGTKRRNRRGWLSLV
jgi:hypothetical protein